VLTICSVGTDIRVGVIVGVKVGSGVNEGVAVTRVETGSVGGSVLVNSTVAKAIVTLSLKGTSVALVSSNSVVAIGVETTAVVAGACSLIPEDCRVGDVGVHPISHKQIASRNLR
jgi:hypothetical protein